MILSKIAEILSEQFGVDKEDITLETNLVEDLGADSLDMVELLMAAEEEFDLNISDDNAFKFKTVGDIVAYIEKNS